MESKHPKLARKLKDSVGGDIEPLERIKKNVSKPMAIGATGGVAISAGLIAAGVFAAPAALGAAMAAALCVVINRVSASKVRAAGENAILTGHNCPDGVQQSLVEGNYEEAVAFADPYSN